MPLIESTFLFVFLPILLVLHLLVTAVETRDWLRSAARLPGLNALLLFASVAFFVLLNAALAGLLVGAAAFNYAMGLAIDRGRDRRRPLAVAVAGNLALLAGFRYAHALGANVNMFAVALAWQPIKRETLIPVVLSFFTLQALAYVVDVYRRDAPSGTNPADAALSLLFFPFVLAGPVVRPREIGHQLARRVVSLGNFAYGTRRFAIGLFKKLVIADTVAVTADAIFSLPAGQLSAGRAWLGLVCYTLQIYFAVSACSDMAIGLGRMFGFRLPENFRWPYVARSVQEFWDRWFLSLSSWSRDYLGVPLGGTSGPLGRLALIFLLLGLWHGTRWTFIVWALYHAGLVLVERVGMAAALRRLPAPLSHAYLLIVVMVGWVFFRSETLTGALVYVKALAGLNASAASAYALRRYLPLEVSMAIIAGVIGSVPLISAIGRWRVAIDSATTAGAMMLFATTMFVGRRGLRLGSSAPRPGRSSLDDTSDTIR